MVHSSHIHARSNLQLRIQLRSAIRSVRILLLCIDPLGDKPLPVFEGLVGLNSAKKYSDHRLLIISVVLNALVGRVVQSHMLAVIHLQFGQLTVSIHFFGKLAIELLMQVCALFFVGIIVQCFTYVGD